jgi:hypothetical protein
VLPELDGRLIFAFRSDRMVVQKSRGRQIQKRECEPSRTYGADGSPRRTTAGVRTADSVIAGYAAKKARNGTMLMGERPGLSSPAIFRELDARDRWSVVRSSL